MEPCSDLLFFSHSGGEVGNCAFQAAQNTPITIVPAGIFTGAVTIPIPTTEAPTTEAPTTETPTTEEHTTEEPTNTAFTRTAFIWFSVGATVFTLLLLL